jgi:hypothetical protein
MVVISFTNVGQTGRFICNNNPIIGRCKVRLLDINMFINATAYTGLLRLDSPDGQLINDKLCGNTFGGIVFDMNTNLIGSRVQYALLNKEKAFEFETNLQTTTLSLNVAQADRAPNEPLMAGIDSGWIVFDVIKI